MVKEKVNNLLSNYKKLLVILAFVFLVPTFSAAFAKDNNSVEYVNSKQNVIFPKLYSMQQDWVYYVSLYDNRMYKIKEDGGEKIQISNDSTGENGIIVWGEWIYYISNSAGEKLCKIKTDGTEKMEIDSIKYNYGAEPFVLWEDSIYYYDLASLIHKINFNGKEVDISNNIEFEAVSKLNLQSKIVGNWLYYWGDEGISKISVGSGEKIKLTTDDIFSKVEIKDNWIYYINEEDSNLYKITVDGKDKTKITDDNMIARGPDYDISNFYVGDNSIFYISNLKGNTKLCRIDFNGKNKSVLAEKAIEFTINEGHIYYIDEVDNGSLYGLKLDGSSINKITSNSFIPYISVENGSIFYGVKSAAIDEPYFGRILMVKSDGSRQLELK